MYQYSLEFFIRIFKLRLSKADNPPELKDRLNALIDDVTKSFFINICRGLFEKDKLLFSYLIATSINIESKIITARDWSFFVRGPTQDPQIDEEKMPSYLNTKQYLLLTALNDLAQNYKGITPSIHDSDDDNLWKEILEA